MELIQYFLVIGLFLLIANVLSKNLLQESFTINIGTPGLAQQTHAQLINGLEDDINKMVESPSQNLTMDEIMWAKTQPSPKCEVKCDNTNQNSPSTCKQGCVGLLPGSPVANQYDYGVSTDCDCKGVTPDLVPNHCGKISTFNANEMAYQNNFKESTPEVISLKINNSIPNYLVSQIQRVDPYDKCNVEASNQNVAESTCHFKSEKTNLSQYFKANPELFSATEKYSTTNACVPYTSAWKEASDCSNNSLYHATETVPSNYVVNKVR